MFNLYDPRDDARNDAGDRGRNLDRGGRGGGDAPDRRDRDPREVFTRDLDLPRGRDRERVRDRDRVHNLDGSEARMLATVGSFRVVAEHDLAGRGDDARQTQQSLRHLENEGLIQRSPLDASDRAVVLTDRGRDLLEAHRSVPHDERTRETRQTFYAGLRKPRELTHDVKVYRAFERAEQRLRDHGGRVRRVVLDYELKRDYQRFLHERNRGRGDCDGRPDREPEEIERWARQHDLPYDEGHVRFPDARLEYEDSQGRWLHEDVEVVTEHYRGIHASSAAGSGFTCFRTGGSSVGGRGRGGRGSGPGLAEEFL